MEDVLAVYARPYDGKTPVVCMDEKPFQLTDYTGDTIPVKSGTPRREDYEYKRTGTRGIFIFTEPPAGRRYAEASPQRTKNDRARKIKRLLEKQYPKAKKVVLVTDNLNTHAVSSPYGTFPPDLAFRFAQRLEIHFTPKHGSWLNTAEIE